MDDSVMRPRLSRSEATTILDLVGLVAVAAGVAYGLWPSLHGFVVAVGGVILIAGSSASTWIARPPSVAVPVQRATRAPLWDRMVERLHGLWPPRQADAESRP